MTDKADNDALIERLERLLPQMADPDWLRSEELPATASLVSMLPAILAALRTPQPDETETLRAAAINLAKAATLLVAATDGDEALRPERQGVLDAMKALNPETGHD